MATTAIGSTGVIFPDASTQAKAGLVAGGTIASGTITNATISTLNAPSGVLATQNGMTGIAKAWVNFVGSTGTITGSYNVSSVTRNATGNYTINFTTAMANTGYAVAGFAQSNNTVNPSFSVSMSSASSFSTTALPIFVGVSNTLIDVPVVCVIVMGA